MKQVIESWGESIFAMSSSSINETRQWQRCPQGFRRTGVLKGMENRLTLSYSKIPKEKNLGKPENIEELDFNYMALNDLREEEND